MDKGLLCPLCQLRVKTTSAFTIKKSEEYKQKLEALQDDPDTEKVHAVADGILCELLRNLGYGEVVDVYEQLDMWYA
jgi:hypothetical protein